MTATPMDYDALARAVTTRRVDELGLTAVEVQARGGPSVSTLTQIERASGTGYTLATLAKLDRALGWEPGSAVGTLRGEPPTAVTGRTVTKIAAPTDGEAHSVSLTLADGTTWFIVGDAPMTPEREELLRAALNRRHDR